MKKSFGLFSYLHYIYRLPFQKLYSNLLFFIKEQIQSFSYAVSYFYKFFIWSKREVFKKIKLLWYQEYEERFMQLRESLEVY